MLRHLTDWNNPRSLSNRLRSRRMGLLDGLVRQFGREVTILDIGGTQAFWEHRGWAERPDVQITLVNLFHERVTHPRMKSVQGDATDLKQFPDGSFDIVFSNSVIEHLFTIEAQGRMAREVARLGEAYFVQTPNYWFPIEPHFHWPGWQWMPRSLRVALLRRFRCGWRGPCRDKSQAERLVDEVQLLTRSQLSMLFPDAELLPERIAGLTKSWMAIRRTRSPSSSRS